MNSLLFIILLFAIINEIRSSYFYPYPKVQKYYDGGDPGDPLFLTPLIEESPEKARELSRVNGSVLDNVEGYSGYITVNKKYNSNLFFWYFPAKTNRDSAPVVLWLQGGPGGSSLFGLFLENGPFELSPTGQLHKRQYSWHTTHHVMYIDNPVGTGFSFTSSDDGYATNEEEVGRDLQEAVLQIFTMFPDLQQLDFYITGESYAGKYVPALAYTIHKTKQYNKKHGLTPRANINLKGLAIGNGLSDPVNQLKYGDYLYQIGLIDINARDIFHQYEEKVVACIKQCNMTCARSAFDYLLGMGDTGSVFKNLTGFEQYYNYLRPFANFSDEILGRLIQSSETRRSIHVGNLTFHDLNGGDNKVAVSLAHDFFESVAPWISELLSYYRVCIYNGQLDIAVAYPLTLNYLQKLEFDGADQYKVAPRYIWKVDGEIAGYVKEVANIVEVLVRNAGHMAPGDQPKWILDMLTRLTRNKVFYH